MDQSFHYNNSLNYDRDGRFAPGKVELSDFHDYRSESYKPPLLNVMQQAQVDEKLQLLRQKGNYSFSIPCVPAIIRFSIFIISHHQYVTQF